MLLPGPATKEQRDQIFQGQLVQALQGISTQLDLLIQLECGYLPRKKMKSWFEAANNPTDPDQAIIDEAQEFPEVNLLSDEMRAKIEEAQASDDDETQFVKDMAEMPEYEPISVEGVDTQDES